jgi:hypothetical protein
MNNIIYMINSIVRNMEDQIIEFIKNDDYTGFNKIQADIDWIDELDSSKIRQFIDKLESPNSVSSQIMGIFYTIGVGTDYSKLMAFNHYKTSAKLGNPHVYMELIYIYLYGCGVRKNQKKARDYILKCIDRTDDINFTNGIIHDLKILISLTRDISDALVDKYFEKVEKYKELEVQNEALERRIKELEAENTEMKYRPPMDGGIGYQIAKEEFEALNNYKKIRKIKKYLFIVYNGKST